MKYIDAEKLKDEIESISFIPQTSADYNDGRDDIKMMFLDIIDSLQQEQSKVDLEKEFESFLDNIEGVPRMWHSDEQIEWAKDIAKHFYELGLKAQKGE